MLIFLKTNKQAGMVEISLKPCLSSECLFIGWSFEFLQYLRLHLCLSGYNRFKTMAILSDNNRWKYSWQVCAQFIHRWATREIWAWRKLQMGVFSSTLFSVPSFAVHFLFILFLSHCSFCLSSPVRPPLFSPSASPSPSLLNLLIWTGQGSIYSQHRGRALSAFNQ